jgi:DNA repair photolyase
MIISASRRTDIPSYYSDWFFKRIKEGFVLVRNPMNYHQISRISLEPEVVDGIVFWTKNPLPMLDRLEELKEYMYYFQFTLTSYENDVEQNIPSKIESLIQTFKTLSSKIGADRVIWRYDPILINYKYSFDYHVRYYEKLAKELHNFTRKVTISFIDEEYRGVKDNIKELALLNFPIEIQRELSSRLAEIAHHYDLEIDTCAEHIDLDEFGIKHARCIDDRLFEKLLGCRLNVDKDKNQRLECGCVISIDVGMYNTCLNGCRYCYANYNRSTVEGNFRKHESSSPLLCGIVAEDDKINERSVKSCRELQLSLFDF